MKKDPVNVIPLDRLQLNDGQLPWLPRNPRTWTQTDIDRTKASLDEDADFMQDRPILATPGDDFTLIAFAGNLRLTAARALGWPGAPVVVYHPEDQIDRETIMRRALKDNGSFGSWDTDSLANEWNAEPWQLEAWGVPDWVTGGAEQPAVSAPGSSTQEDDFDENQEGILVRCKPGDVWQLGDHRLMCGDSTDLETVKSLMGGVLADMVFTDPPYGVAIGSKNKALDAAGVGSGRIKEDITNDTLPVDDLYKVLQRAMENVRESCKDDASYYVCAPPGGDMGLMMMMMMRDAGLTVRHQIVWNKNSATFSLGRLDYDYKHEAIMYTWTKKHHNYRAGEFRTSVWDIDKPLRNDLHPTMKPLALIEGALKDGTKEGDVVLDAFGGSGSTLIACEQLGRRCYMMEIDPHYCDVILARWEKLTGRQAEKIAPNAN